MQNTLTRYLANVPDGTEREALRAVLAPLFDRASTQTLTSAGLVIGGGSKLTAEVGAAAFYVSVKGKIRSVAAATDMAALVGTVTNAKYNVYAFFIDAAGTLSSAMGTEAATLVAVTLPPIPENKALIGFLIINPTGTGNFVGGTTALDDGTVTPGALYISVVGSFEPTALIS